jgi:hypothetical protein
LPSSFPPPFKFHIQLRAYPVHLDRFFALAPDFRIDS